VAGEEQDAAVDRDRRAKRKGVERLDVDRYAAQRTPVPARVLDQGRATGYPDGAAAAAVPLVEDDAGAFASLSDTCTVGDEEARPIDCAIGILMELVAGLVGRNGARQIALAGFPAWMIVSSWASDSAANAWSCSIGR
jgi:hypothetical protein